MEGTWPCGTYSVQVDRDVAIGVNNGLVTAELHDLANDKDISAEVRVQITAGYTRSRDVVHFSTILVV
jgi:hypothetical protein